MSAGMDSAAVPAKRMEEIDLEVAGTKNESVKGKGPTVANNHELQAHAREQAAVPPPTSELGCCGKCTKFGEQGCCGLPPMPHDFEEIPEGAYMSVGDRYVLITFSVLVMLGFVGVAIHAATGLDEFTPPTAGLLIEIGRGFLIFHAVFGFMGFFVVRCGLNVAVSRKILHVVLMLLSIIGTTSDVDTDAKLRNAIFNAVSWGSVGVTLNWASWNVQIRKRCWVLDMSYRSIERPSDRPFVPFWSVLQVLSLPMVLVPFKHFAVARESTALLWIPAMCLGFGDGLAEPIGRRFGKHKYTVRALCTNNRYVRSYEGSSNVAFWTMVGVILAYLFGNSSDTNPLTFVQALILALLMPPFATLTEAISPHTLDNQFLVGICFLIVWFVVDIVGPL